MLNKENNIELIKLLNDVSCFSHAYLFETNSMKEAYPYVLKVAKKILCPKETFEKDCLECNICHLIDEGIYEDCYVINPDTISINKEELDKLFLTFSSKSLQKNGHRVYIICGFERMSPYVSNKILKFLEEPVDGVHALLITENINMILPTIKSRCQIININFLNILPDNTILTDAVSFIKGIIKYKSHFIAYTYDYLFKKYDNKEMILNFFNSLEQCLMDEIINRTKEKNLDNFADISLNQLKQMIKITDKMILLINNNINLNLLVDRYIIEVKEVIK